MQKKLRRKEVIARLGEIAFGRSNDAVKLALLESDAWPNELDAMKRRQRRIELIVPCHHAILYDFNFPIWDQIKAAYATWNAIGYTLTVNELERYVPTP